MATDAFRRAGFQAYNLAGGVLAWERSGLPFTGSVAPH
jgi:rhodanese-related sulfurtransferase